jgi:UDP-N-acetylglucosamine--N-acetylmuramyl-(pentapeptide) pyrophosphoryl-undecaprenol N-acetylglucosamine transferase
MWEKKYMSRPMHKRVIISGGGTGGHIFPAVAIADALCRIDPAAEILFVGAEGRMEMDKVPAAGYRIIGLPVSGFDRKNLLRNFAVIVKLFRSIRKAKRILKEFNPDVVVGVGGYASGPVLWQAGRMKIPSLIQEQNSYAGITNRLLASRAAAVCVAYEGMDRYFPAKKIIITGNPVRKDLEGSRVTKNEALDYFGLSPEQPVILILGGSLGAGSINKCFADNIQLLKESGFQWLWQSGKYYFADVNSTVSGSGAGNIKVVEFINRMDHAYAAADIIVSRAGAGTISELCLAGKPVILIPSPNVAEDHQTMNAGALASKDAALMIPDREIGQRLVNEAIGLVRNEQMKAMLSENILKMAVGDADRRIAEEVIKIIGE